MSDRLQNVLEAALELPADERASLAEELLRSLDEATPSPAEQAAIDAAWKEEIGKRRDDHLAGRTTPVPAQDVFARIRARLG